MRKALFLPLVLALSGAALAQTTTPPPAGIPSSWIGIGLGILGSVLAFALVRLNSLATVGIEKIKNEGFKKLLEGVWTVTSAKVAQLLQTTVNEIKKNSADGSLTLEDARAALMVAVSEIWQALPPAQQKQLGEAAAKPEDKTAEQKAARARELIIAPQVEKAVAEQKTESVVFTAATKSETERILAGTRAAEARKALQDRLAKAQGLPAVRSPGALK